MVLVRSHFTRFGAIGVLGTRSLIQLDVKIREATKANAATNSNANTPTKAKKPEILLVSK